jgi:hypothetical protein
MVKLPDDSIIESSHTCYLNLPNLPKQATKAHLFPALGNTSLLSISTLCDAGCEAIFRAHECLITFMGDTILQGDRTPATNSLWHIQLPTHQANLAMTTPSATPADLVAFAHASLFSPVLSTLQTSLDLNYLTNMPGISKATLNKYKPHSKATVKGHMQYTIFRWLY